MQHNCTSCGNTFEVTDSDLDFLRRVSPVIAGNILEIPPPKCCPACRRQRRFAYRNERRLYRRKCDLTGKPIISFYRPDSPYKVYDKDAWWSDNWDALEYGRDMDLLRSFFEQFRELRRVVPRMGMMLTQDEGSAFSAYCAYSKNCYMCTSCVVNEGSFYCYQANDSRDCVDCTNVTQCELCYECLHCFKLYSSLFCQDCENSDGLFMCKECRGCSGCIGCVNLSGKKHWLFNKPATEAEYKRVRESMKSALSLQAAMLEFRKLASSLPVRFAHLTQCENCTGDHLRNCRNAHDCFDAVNMEDCRFVFPAPGLGMKDCRDCHYSPGSELVYDSMSALQCQRARFALHSWNNEEVSYVDECFNGRNLFGCIGLKHKQYCILNRQYTKEEYETLVPKLIGLMRRSGEWGEYLPVAHSPFAYNETIAQDELPISKEQAETKGWRWVADSDEMPQVGKTIPAARIPDRIDEVPDDIINWALESEESGRPFRIIKQELDFYRSCGLPAPRTSPDERYTARIARRNPRRLWKRECAKCQKTMTTSFAPDRPEKVYCEVCYLKEVY